MTPRRPISLAAFLVVMLVVAACSSSKRQPSPSTGASPGQPSAASGGKDGRLVIGADQLPTCLNPITACSGSPWTHLAVDQYVLPKLMTFDKDNNFVPSAVLAAPPTNENGGIRDDPFTIVFKLNPRAVWDDGTPITSADVDFTWHAYLETKGSVNVAGYDRIAAIDATDPTTAVVQFKAPYADWPDLFGGKSGYLLKKAAFPNGTDVSQAMQTDIPFSGMPWKLQTFVPNNQSVLVPNPAYWVKADQPELDHVTFVPLGNEAGEVDSVVKGEVAGIYAQPSPGYAKKLKVSKVSFKSVEGSAFEGLWLNLSKKPLDDPKVRQALFMSVDRQAILDQVIKPDDPEVTVLNCGGWVPTIGKWCDNTQFADIKYDPEGAKKLLQAAGWKLGADGVFAKGRVRLDFELNTVTGDSRRETVEQLIVAQAKAAGIAFHVKNYDSNTLFGSVLPHLGHTAAIYAQTTGADPTVTDIFSCDAIPSAANNFQGLNVSAWCNKQATALMTESDATLDVNQRINLIRNIGAMVRSDLVWLPLYQLPAVAAVRTDLVAGPVFDFARTPLTNLYNLNQWHSP